MSDMGSGSAPFPSGADPRCIVGRGVPTTPAPLMASPASLDTYFQRSEKLYRQGLISRYMPSALREFGGVLSLAAADAESARAAMTSDSWIGWMLDMRDPKKLWPEAHKRWVVHESAIRAAITAGVEPEQAIRDYFARTTKTEPHDNETLDLMTRTVAPSYLPAWQDEIETQKDRFRRLVRAPHDMPIGFTIMSARSLVDPPKSESDVDWLLYSSSKLEAGLGGLADLRGGRNAGSRAMVENVPSPPPAAPSAWHSTSAGTTGSTKSSSIPPELDVRSVGDGGWTPIDDQARGLRAPDPAAPSGGRPPRSVPEAAVPSAGSSSGPRPDLDSLQFIVTRPDPAAASVSLVFEKRYRLSKANNLLELRNSRWRRVFEPMAPSARAKWGYSNSQLDEGWREALRDYWEGRGLARQLPNGTWEMYDIELKQWFPQSEIDMGHIVSAVEHHQMVQKALAPEVAKDPVAAESKRKAAVRTFMRDFTNYVPQQSARNQELGRNIGLTYDGIYPDFKYGR